MFLTVFTCKLSTAFLMTSQPPSVTLRWPPQLQHLLCTFILHTSAFLSKPLLYDHTSVTEKQGRDIKPKSEAHTSIHNFIWKYRLLKLQQKREAVNLIAINHFLVMSLFYWPHPHKYSEFFQVFINMYRSFHSLCHSPPESFVCLPFSCRYFQ